jgi:hypothetical protein
MIGPADPEVSLKLRASTFSEMDFEVVDDRKGIFAEKYADKLAELAGYDAPEDIEFTRTIKGMDECRDEFFIDDVRVNMILPGLKTEECWVRITGTTEDNIIGALLNEPYQDFGWHKGDEIPFFLHMTEDGKTVCISDLIPTHTIKAEDLEGGVMLSAAICHFVEERNEYNFIHVLEILRDSNVWVPCNAVMSDGDEAKFAKMIEDAGGDLDAIINKPFVNDDYIRLIPDILQYGDDYYFPVFSSAEEMGDYGDGFSKVERHILDVLPLARNNEKEVKGIVINAFSTPFIVDVKVFDAIEKMKSRIEE